MPTIADIKQQYPDLGALDDDQVVDALHQAFYADMPREQVAQSLGVKPPPPPKTNTSNRVTSDLYKSVKSGILQLPGQVTGLTDIPAALLTGQRPISDAADWVGEKTGFQPGKWAKEIQYSPESQQSQQEIEKTWKDPNSNALDVAGAYLKNPAYSANQVAQSLPAMIAGGVLSRSLMTAGRAAPVVADRAANISAKAGMPGYLERTIGDKWAASVAGGIGEGAAQAGQQMDQYSGDDQRKNAIAAVGSGAIDAAIGAGAGRIAQALGLETAETAMAKGLDARKVATPISATRRIAGGMASEAVLQELPQSIQEQNWQNWSEGKPLMEGALRQGVEGAIAGGVMGAGANIRSGTVQGHAPAGTPPPASPPLLLGNTPDPYLSFADGTVARKSEIVAYINSLPPDLQPAARAKAMGLAPQPAMSEATPSADMGNPITEPATPITPAQAMGIDPAAGPLSSAAAIAVDTGTTQEIQRNQASEADQAAYDEATAVQEQQAQQQDSAVNPITTGPIAEAAMSPEDKQAILFSNQPVADGGIRYTGTQDGDILNGLGKPYATRMAAQRRVQMEGKDWMVTPVFDGFVARRKDALNGTTDATAAVDQGADAGTSDQPTGSGTNSLAEPVPGTDGAGSLPGAPDGRGEPDHAVVDAGDGTAAVAQGASHVQDPTPAAQPAPAQATGTTTPAVAGNATATEGLPAAGTAAVEAAGVAPVDNKADHEAAASTQSAPLGITPREPTVDEQRIAAKAEPMLDLHKAPTGWKRVPIENGNGVVLVSADGKQAIPFTSTNLKSGTEGLRQSAKAQAYAIDNPYQIETPQGELVVKPVFQPKGSNHAETSETQQVEPKQKTPERAAGEQVKPKLTSRARIEQAKQARADYFTPGNIVKGYGGHDEVLSYHPGGDGSGWSVKVRAVVKEDGKWIQDQKDKRDRVHATQPDARELKAGPVERSTREPEAEQVIAAPYKKPAEPKAEQPAQSKGEPWTMSQEDYVAQRMDSVRNDKSDPEYGAMMNYVSRPKGGIELGKFVRGLETKFAREWFDANEQAAIDGKPVLDKPTWMMTKKEFETLTGNDVSEHSDLIKMAIEANKPIQKNVLAEYKDVIHQWISDLQDDLQSAQDKFKRAEQKVNQKNGAMVPPPIRKVARDAMNRASSEVDSIKEKISLYSGYSVKANDTEIMAEPPAEPAKPSAQPAAQDTLLNTFKDPVTGKTVVVSNKATAQAIANSKQLERKSSIRTLTVSEGKTENLKRVGYDNGEDIQRGYVIEVAQPAAKPEPRTAVQIAHDIGKAEPDTNVKDLIEKARQAIKDELGQQALDGMTQDTFMRSGDLTQALHDGQYDAVREYAANMPVPVHESDIPRETANRAHSGTSYSPEQRGASARRDYVRTMADAWKQAERATRGDPEALARVTSAMQDVVDGYRSRYITSLEAHSRVMSSMIAGPANFPVASNRKKSDTADKRAGEAEDFLKKGIARMLKSAREPIDNSPDSELARVRANLEGREAQQARMKEINAAHAKFQRNPASLEKSGLSEQDQKLIREHKPRYSWEPHPYAPYELTNNNAEIRRLQERLASAEQRIGEAAAGPVETTRTGVRIEENAQDDRLRLFFDGKPSEEIRTDLKSNGFKWSPNAGAWQRQLTDNARSVATRLMDKHFPETDKGVTLFSRSTDTVNPGGQPAARAQALVNAITARWKNAPKAVVVQSLDDPRVPEKVRNEGKLLKSDLKTIRSNDSAGEPDGFFDKDTGTVYLIADKMPSDIDVVRVLMHESLGHYGLRGQYGAELGTILDRIAVLNSAKVKNAAKRLGLDFEKPSERRLATEEVLAYMAQTTPELGWVKRTVAAVRAWLRQHIPGFGKMQLSDDELIRDYIIPARQFVEDGSAQGGKSVTSDEETPFSRSEKSAFDRWFGDSKVVDSEGRPLVVYHGTTKDFSAFDMAHATKGSMHPTATAGFFLSQSADVANYFAGQEIDQSDWPAKIGYKGGSNVMPTFLSITNPKEITAREFMERFVKGRFYRDKKESFHDWAREGGHDGVLIKADPALAESMGGDEYMADTWVALRPEQIKSAVGNNGNFDASNPDIRFSRNLGDTLTSAANNVRDVNLPAGYKVSDLINGAPGKLNWWHKSIGTQYNLAQRSAPFKKVYDSVQNFINDVSYYATEAADLAPTILPKLETMKDIGKSPLSAEDTKAVSAPVFEGTLTWARDESGQPVKLEALEHAAANLTTEQKAHRLLRNDHISEGVLKMWQGLDIDQYETLINNKYERDMLKPGVVWTPAELKSIFKLNDKQIGLYQEFRKATDKSLTNLAIADMLRFGGDDVVPIREAALDAKTPAEAATMLADYLRTLTDLNPQRRKVLLDTADKMIEKGDKANELIARGYAPLSRFGQYTLDVVHNGERVYFGLFENKWEAAKMNRKMNGLFPGATINQGTVSEQAYKMFAGVSPETLELFGDMLGLEGSGDGAANAAFQTYLKLARSNRSAMKRLIQRKGIAGFSEDAGRVLAGFVYSNARQTASSLHMGNMTRAAADKEAFGHNGELQDAATKLVDYIKNPQEEAQAFRGLMFAQYIGGSVASAMVNMTQPLTMTFPWLTQYGTIADVAKQMVNATKDANKKNTGDAKLDAALHKAEEDGTVSPQEVHQLMQQAMGQGVLRSGDGTTAGNAMATAQNTLSRIGLAWGKMFSTAEQFNRRVTFIAAYRTAVQARMADPDAFARKAIAETQGVYNRGNKPQWARGALGSTLFTFKQYSISYVEMLSRMAKNGPQGRKAALLALAVMFVLSGASGLPGSDDLDDIISGALQAMGYNFDSKQKRKEFFVSLIGEGGADFMERGISGLPGVPVDVSGRLGIGNLIPGTGLLTKKTDHTRDVAEFAGVAGDFLTRGFDTASKVIKGDIGGVHGAVATMAPKAAQNLFQAYDMANTGMYRDAQGRKVLDTDAGDALSKAIGLQPNDVKRVQDAAGDAMRMIGLNRIRESEIAGEWAAGLFEKDQAKVQAAREDLKQWNIDNPDSPIKINFRQILLRVRKMNESKIERIAKTSPKEIRASVKRELLASQ